MMQKTPIHVPSRVHNPTGVMNSWCHRSIYPKSDRRVHAACMQCAVHVYMYMPCASCDSLKQAVAFSAFFSIQLLALFLVRNLRR